MSYELGPDGKPRPINRNPWDEAPSTKTPTLIDGMPIELGHANPWPEPEDPKPAVLLAHGMKFVWDIWKTTGTINALAHAGHEVIAPDLPQLLGARGEANRFPASRTRLREPVEPGDFLASTLQHFGVEKAVAGFHSRSAEDFASPIVRNRSDLLSGLVLIAPVGFEIPDEPSEVPALIAWGKRDKVADPSNALLVAKGFETSVVAMFDDRNTYPETMGHAPHLDNQVAFNEVFAWFAEDPATAHQRIGDISLSTVSISAIAA